MKKLLAGLVALPFLAGVAMAGQPMALTDGQMDRVTAGAIEYETAPFGIEFSVYTPDLGGFSFRVETGGADSTPPTSNDHFCIAGACPIPSAAAGEPPGVFGLTHGLPIGPWMANHNPAGLP